MAQKSTKSKPRMDAGGTTQFVGPAQQPFQSFLELAKFTLDTYQPNWNDPIKPSSYISPATYPFKNPDKSDLAIDLEKKMLEGTKQKSSATQPELNSLEKPRLIRRADMGEFEVFQALWKLAQENVQAPFLAFRSPDLEKMKDYFQQIFPHVRPDIQGRFKKMMREYDFVLIGPRIGIIVIEVKSSKFSKGEDFAPNNRHLPDHIMKAITQLDSFDLEFIRECAGLQSAPVVPMRKVLFTSNLKKSRLENWYDNLNQLAKENVDKRLKPVIHWFQDDMSSDLLKSALYNSLRKMIEADGFQIPVDVYELYGPVIVGLGSALVIKSQQSVEIIQKHISTSTAILRDAAALESQDPTGILLSAQSGAKRKRNKEKKAKLILSSKMVLLTDEQRKALNGQNHQFIIGAAGTGKTIVLQAKALEMLDMGKRVLVFATPNFSHRYGKLFDDHGFKNYEVRSLRDFLWGLNQLIYRDREISSVLNDLGKPITKILDHLISIISGKDKIHELFNNVISISKFDAIFIDDAIDLPMAEQFLWVSASIMYLLFSAIMAFGKFLFGFKILWIVLDPSPNFDLLQDMDNEDWQFSIRNARFHNRILEEIVQLDTGYFSYSCLHQVMRCSESVFQSAYRLGGFGQMAVKPILGHKIHGFCDIVSFRAFEESTDSTQIEPLLWKHIKRALDRFRQEGFDYGQMAVILDYIRHDPWSNYRYNYHYIPIKCTECGIPNVNDDFSSESAKGKLVISHWHDVSSLEWPVIIFVSSADRRYYKKSWISKILNEDYQRYRGCSRATMRIFQINVQYFLNSSTWEADVYKGMTGRYTITRAKEDLHVSNMSETADQLARYTNEDTPKMFWERTMRRSFSVHNLDLSTILVGSERFKNERHKIKRLIDFAIKSRFRSLLRSAEKRTENKCAMDDEEIESTRQATPAVSSQQGNDFCDEFTDFCDEFTDCYGQLIFETFQRLPEEKRDSFKDFWIDEMSDWTRTLRNQDKDIEQMFMFLCHDFGGLTGFVLRHCPQKRLLIGKFCSLVKDDKVLRNFC